MLLAALFALAYTQAPLFFSNQNQYFVHGLAAAGRGHLDRDWLAGTADPTPVFSAFVAVAGRHLGDWSFQATYFAMLMGYFLAARELAFAVPGVRDSSAFRLGFAALFTLSHAALPRLLSVLATGVDYPWFLQAGVAGQYVLGPGLQPSAFGTLLFGAVAAIACGRPFLAAALAAAAGVMHATYLLPAALFTFGAMVHVAATSRFTHALRLGGLALAVVMPVVAYAATTFAPTPAFAEAQRILAVERIPHHADIDRWFDGIAVVQIAWIAIGIVLMRKSSAFAVLIAMVGGGMALSLVQYATKNHTLALLFPWRVSAILVPVATTAAAARIASAVRPGRIAAIVSVAIVVGLAVAGAWIMIGGHGYYTTAEEDVLLTWVREHAGPDDVFLLPAKFPAVGTGRGVFSSSFTPRPGRSRGRI